MNYQRITAVESAYRYAAGNKSDLEVHPDLYDCIWAFRDLIADQVIDCDTDWDKLRAWILGPAMRAYCSSFYLD